MSNIKDLLQKYKSQKKNKETEIKKMEKTIQGYGFGNCKTRNDFKIEKSKIELKLKEVRDEILRAGRKYDSALVVSLKNKEGRLKTKRNDLNDIMVLLDKINGLKREISHLKDEIRKLENKINPVDNEREQMNIVLKALRNNYSCEDAARLANIEMKRIVNWIHEGKSRTNKNKAYFFKYYSKIQTNKSRKIEKILKHLKNGKTKEEACKLAHVSVNAADIWYTCGKIGKDKINIDFYNKVNLLNETRKRKQMTTILNETHGSRYFNKGIQSV